MKGHGLYSCFGTASSPLLSSTCCSCRVCCPLNVISLSLSPCLHPSFSLSLLVSGLAFQHQAVVSESKIQSPGVQELVWGDAALPGIMDGVKPQQIAEVTLTLLCLAVMLTMTDISQVAAISKYI